MSPRPFTKEDAESLRYWLNGSAITGSDRDALNDLAARCLDAWETGDTHRPQRAEVERLAKVYAVYRDLYVHRQVPIENKQHEDAMQELLDYTCGPPGTPEGQP